MKIILTLSLMIFFNSARASLLVSDKSNLAVVTLHTELAGATKRVYLAADFEAKHKTGLISCDLTVEHKNGLPQGPVYRLSEETTLLPNEKIPLNLGLFPERFHASGLDVVASLKCREVTYFTKKKTLLKSTQDSKTCCRLNEFKVICTYRTVDDSVDVNYTELTSSLKATQDYDPCYPPSAGD